MAQAQDHYAVLQVHPSAHPDVIQAAYRRLALLYHPDKNPSAEAARMMARINVAYEVLSDPERRAEYDRERRASSDNASYTPPYETEPADYSATSESGRESRDSGRRFTTVPVGQAARSAVGVIKLQIGFFGRPINVIAGVIALLPFAMFGFVDSVGEALLTLPFAVIAFFWWWFLGSVVLFVAWKVCKRGTAMARSLVRALRHAGDGRDDSVVQSEEVAAENQDKFWVDLRTHLAVLGRTAGGAVLETARFFGWPISTIALLLTLWGSWESLSEAIITDTLFPFGISASGGAFIFLPAAAVIFIIMWPVCVLAVFLIWLFWAAIVFTVWQWFRLLIMLAGRSEKGRDEER